MNGVVHLKYASYKAGANDLKDPETVLAVNNLRILHKLDRIDYLRDSIREFKKTILGFCG